MNRILALLMFLLVGIPSSNAAIAALKPEKVTVADARKTKAYIRDGIVTGGDRAINDVTITNIRRAPNSGYERVVIDLMGNRSGEPVGIERPPFYHVAVSSANRRITVTIIGKTKLEFNSKAVHAYFKKSPIVGSLELLPIVESDRWSFTLQLKRPTGVEVFELSRPSRIILDLKSEVPRSARKAKKTLTEPEGIPEESIPPDAETPEITIEN